jgi:hypothetical protein
VDAKQQPERSLFIAFVDAAGLEIAVSPIES